MSDTHGERWVYSVAFYVDVADDELDADKQADAMGEAIVSALERSDLPGVWPGTIAEDDFRSAR